MQLPSEFVEALQELKHALDSNAKPNTKVSLNILFQKPEEGVSKSSVSYRLERIVLPGPQSNLVVPFEPVQLKVVPVASNEPSEEESNLPPLEF